MEYLKKISDTDFHKYQGRHFGESWYSTIINSDKDGYSLDPEGGKKVLFKFRKKRIPDSLREIAISTFLKESKKKHSNRGTAGGVQANGNARSYTSTGQNEGQYIASNISGYFDRPLREHRGLFETQKVCRTTAFTIRNKSLWNQGLPFVQKCSKEYSRLAPKEYLVQKREYSKINTKLRIPDTVFTTVTSNYNLRTACHKDSGDFSSGLGNLIVVGNGFSGGYLGFPQFKILIKIEPGDFLLMDTHEYHCNTPIKILTSEGFRLSFVMYIRSDMSGCKTKKLVGDTTYYY